MCGFCGGVFGFAGAWGMMFVGGGGGFGGSVLHVDFAHGICISFQARRRPHGFQISVLKFYVFCQLLRVMFTTNNRLPFHLW